MKGTRSIAVSVLASCLVASPATAELRLSFEAGRVTLAAVDVSLRAVLEAWAVEGLTLISNIEQLSAEPVTLELTDVTETEALTTLLSSQLGYVASRRSQLETGRSAFLRIMILASGSARPRAFTRPTAAAPPASEQPRPRRGPLFGSGDVSASAPGAGQPVAAPAPTPRSFAAGSSTPGQPVPAPVSQPAPEPAHPDAR